MSIFETLVYAFFAGLLPALVWLWFWLHEDSEHPEPRSLLALTFMTGMAMIFFAIPLETLFQNTASPVLRFGAWAIIEELLKFAAAYLAALHTKAFDEPIDAVVYLICAALGFAALENTLFVLKALAIFNGGQTTFMLTSGNVVSSVFLTNLRFIGANLLHVLASSAIGIGMALSFKKTREEKVVWTLGGIGVAIVLHTIFNLFIMNTSDSSIFFAFVIVWLAMIGLMLMFEKIKK